MHQTPEMWFFICVIIVAASALMQAIMMTVIAVVAIKTRSRVHALTERIDNDVMPAVKVARDLLEETSPKIKLATDQVLDISRTVRLQVEHVNDALNDIVDKTHAHASRVDEGLTMVLNGIGKAGGGVQRATGETSRKVGAVMTGIRVGMEVLRAKRRTRKSSDGTPGTS